MTHRSGSTRGGRTPRRIKPNPGSTRSVPSREVTADPAGQPKPATRPRRPAGDDGPTGAPPDGGRDAERRPAR
jgi:hypothetical protein